MGWVHSVQTTHEKTDSVLHNRNKINFYRPKGAVDFILIGKRNLRLNIEDNRILPSFFCVHLD